jgi:HSP20 family protein
MSRQSGGFFLDVQRQLDDAFEKLIYRRWAIPNPAEWRPRLDLHETADAYFIEIDLPGVPPERIEIQVTEGSLTIAGTRPSTRPEGALLSHRERESGSFRRLVTLSQPVAPDRVESAYRHGIYQIRLFKKPIEEPARPSAGSFDLEATGNPHRP